MLKPTTLSSMNDSYWHGKMSCAIGPSEVTATDVDDPHDLLLTISISRDGTEFYDGETSTGEMVRSCDELVSYYRSHNSTPELAVLLTGTSIVPDNGFTLQEGDEIEISLEEIGTLTNTAGVV